MLSNRHFFANPSATGGGTPVPLSKQMPIRSGILPPHPAEAGTGTLAPHPVPNRPPVDPAVIYRRIGLLV